MKKSINISIAIIGLIINLVFLQEKANGQEYNCYYTVGKPCPDFTFNKVVNYSTKKVSISDFRGKWLILDFWYKGCSACIKSFATTSQLQDKFKNNIQFLLVGLQDEEEEINPLFERLQKSMKLRLACAFDSVLMNQVVELHHGMPFNVIIDPDGIVRGSVPTLEGIDLAELTSTKRPVLRDYYREMSLKIKYDDKTPYLVNGNGGNDSNFLFRSLLSKWTPLSPVRVTGSYLRKQGRLEILGAKNLSTLYLFAYLGSDMIEANDSMYGHYWPKAIIEAQDTSIFVGNRKTGENVYSYSLTVPISKANPEFMMQIMQQDLHNYFGYHAKFEIRKRPCWKLIASDIAKKRLLVNRDSTEKQTPLPVNGTEWQVFDLKNANMRLLTSMIARYSSVESEGIPIIDETGIQNKVNIHLDFIPFNFNSVLKSLHENGLDLIKGEKEMKVLIIRD